MRIDTKFPPRRGKVTPIRGIGYSTYVQVGVRKMLPKFQGG